MWIPIRLSNKVIYKIVINPVKGFSSEGVLKSNGKVNLVELVILTYGVKLVILCFTIYGLDLSQRCEVQSECDDRL